jgi:TPP-dependent pyruvate/acetoin dehydrogenase alpha subunit
MTDLIQRLRFAAKDDYRSWRETALLNEAADALQRLSAELKGQEMAARDEIEHLRAALIDLEDEVRILLRDNDVEVTEGMSCAIDIAREALRGRNE